MDKRFYEQAAREFLRGSLDPALMAKAIATTGGDEAKAKAAYLTLRAEELQSADRARRIKNAAYMTAAVTGTGTVLAGKAAVSATQHLWPVFVRISKVLLWVLIGLSLASGVLYLFLTSTPKALTSPEQSTSRDSSAAVAARPNNQFRPIGYSLGDTKVQQDGQYDAMLSDLERQYPPLNPSSRQFNPSLVSKIESRIAVYESQGLSGPAALQKAALELTKVRVLIPRAETSLGSTRASHSGISSAYANVSSSDIDYDNPHNMECWRQYQNRLSGIPDSTPLGQFSQLNSTANAELQSCVKK